MSQATPAPTADESQPARFRIRLGGLTSVAKHPLTLLAVGAVVSGLLVPALTRGAQNHQKGLEIKRPRALDERRSEPFPRGEPRE